MYLTPLCLPLLGLACNKCASGTRPAADFASCINCTTGSAGLDGVCSACRQGRHAPIAGMRVCTACKPGRVARGEGGHVCAACPAGKAQPWARKVYPERPTTVASMRMSSVHACTLEAGSGWFLCSLRAPPHFWVKGQTAAWQREGCCQVRHAGILSTEGAMSTLYTHNPRATF